MITKQHIKCTRKNTIMAKRSVDFYLKNLPSEPMYANSPSVRVPEVNNSGVESMDCQESVACTCDNCDLSMNIEDQICCQSSDFCKAVIEDYDAGRLQPSSELQSQLTFPQFNHLI